MVYSKQQKGYLQLYVNHAVYSINMVNNKIGYNLQQKLPAPSYDEICEMVHRLHAQLFISDLWKVTFIMNQYGWKRALLGQF